MYEHQENPFIFHGEHCLEIGGGTAPLPEGVINLDSVHGEGQWKRRAQDTPWPAESDSMDTVRASHVMEHIPAGEERIRVMNEVHRVLKPGGLFCIMVPVVVDLGGRVHPLAFADPTHVSYWCKISFSYFDGEMAANADYGIKRWKTLGYQEGLQYGGAIWTGTPDK